MQTTCPIKKGGNQKNRYEYLRFFSGIYVSHDPVYSDRSKHTDEGIKDHIGVIITKTENIEDGKDLNKRIALEIIPIGVFGSKKFEYPTGVWIVKKVTHVFRGVLK
jgi:hypothetical protein